MNTPSSNRHKSGLVALTALLLAATGPAWAAHRGHLIEGISGPAFTLGAKDGYLSTSDGNSLYFWGYGTNNGPAQYTGPTLLVNQGDVVTVTLNNHLPVPTSIVWPGQKAAAAGGSPGLLTREAPAASGGVPGTVTYTFTASEPGTYLYHSGTQPDLQVEMGLVGALIVRPVGFNPADAATWKAYGHVETRFDDENLFLLTEMDESIHDRVELQVKSGRPVAVDMTKWYPVYWFINGRTGPDTMLPAFASYLPAQPYPCMPMFHPGQKTLLRVLGGGRDPHPFHHHGNHSRIIARDGRLLNSAPGAGPDLAYEVFTIPSTPGGTVDALFSWTGEKLGWDPYGHASDVDNPPLGWSTGGPRGNEDVDWDGDGVYEVTPMEPHEYAGDHGKPFPVMLPPDQDLTFGMMYGGSPFIGLPGTLPPGQGGFNPSGGFMFMWHSHAEKEICNNNIFPGGMLTMALVEAYPRMPMPMPIAGQ